MAKSKAETPAKKPRARKAAPAAVPEEQAAPVSGAEAAPETLEAIPQAAAPNEAMAQPEAPEEVPAAGVEAQAAPEGDKAAETAPKGCPAVVRAPKGLNLRIGPALNYEVLGVLPDGAGVTALELPMGAEVPGWRLVTAGKWTGWASSRFLRLER